MNDPWEGGIAQAPQHKSDARDCFDRGEDAAVEGHRRFTRENVEIITAEPNFALLNNAPQLLSFATHELTIAVHRHQDGEGQLSQ